MDPVEALERIVYLRDRARHQPRRVRAFSRAAETLRQRGPQEVETLAREGRLEELPWVGPVIASIISEALEGKVPAYLQKLEEETVVVAQRSEALRAQLRGDCHTHTVWSDGGATVERMARTAMALGHDYLVVTDHSPRLTVAKGLSRERLEEQLAEIEALNTELAPFRILTGMEVDILEDGALDDPGGLLGELDVVVGSVHSKLRMPGEEMTPRLLAALADPDLDILGHVTGRLVTGRGRPQSEFDAEAVFEAVAEHGKALEVNCRPERVDPPDDLLELAVGKGCLFAVDTDAHSPGQLEWLIHGTDRLHPLEVGPERIVNAWPTDELLAWAACHQSR